jgi:hypothetical protein
VSHSETFYLPPPSHDCVCAPSAHARPKKKKNEDVLISSDLSAAVMDETQLFSSELSG